MSRRSTVLPKVLLRTSVLDKNSERERLHLLDEVPKKTANLENDGMNVMHQSGFQNIVGYGSLQPCNQNGDFYSRYANTVDANVDCNYLLPSRYVRSFSSGGKQFSNYDEGVIFKQHNTNLVNSASQTFSNNCDKATGSCSVLQYSPNPPPKRYEVPPVYFFKRGGSARGSVSSTTNLQQQRASMRNFQYPSNSDSYAHIESSFRDLNNSTSQLNHFLKQDRANMSDLRDAQYANNDLSTLEGNGGSPNVRFDDGNDFFVNFNATLDRLPALQRKLGDRLRRHLQFFFMNPLQKYQIRRQFPFKLFLQILKVVFITIQLILFAELRISHVDFLDDSVTVMRHRFLKNWDNNRDEVVYPPDSGKYSVFNSNEIVEHFGYIVKSYYTLQNDSFASYSYDTTFSHIMNGNETISGDAPHFEALIYDFARIPPIRFCRDRIADVTVQNDTYIFDISQVKECFSLNFTREEIKAIVKDMHAIRRPLANRNISFGAEDALSMSKTTLAFNLRTIHFSPLSTDQKPECYLIKITIEFDNSRHTGQVFVKLNSIISYVNLCNGRVLQVFTVGLDTVAIGIIDVFVLLMCLFSLMLCSRALIKAHLLKKTTCEYFTIVFNRRLSVSDQLEFFNLWYVMILVNDILIVLGTVCKVTIEFRDFDSDLFTLTGIMLGLGALLVYIGLLRYLGFFSQYNLGSMAECNFQILVLTLKRSLPSILRFMVCTIILYVGFLIAGWVIIGPYSIKFRTLSQSSEALFSLLNGDDMFATFYTISDSSTTIKVVGTIYIYFFVCLFIYIVLSLFIAIIMDSYEVVKERYDQTAKVEQSMLYEFLASAAPPNESSLEAREIFAADRLLRLDDGWLLQNWSEIRSSLRQILRNARGRDRGGSGSNAEDPTHGANGGSGAGQMFGYQAFENPAQDSRGVSGDGSSRRLSSDFYQQHASRACDTTLISTLANGGSIAIATEQHDQDDEGLSGDVDGHGAARYQVSPHSDASLRRCHSPKTPRLELADDVEEIGVVRLDGFDPHDEGVTSLQSASR